MAHISLTKVQNVLPEFIETRLIPTAPEALRWLLGGLTVTALQQAPALLAKARPTLTTLGMLNEKDQLDIEMARRFILAGFDKAPTVTMVGFRFNREDGDALIGILDKYKDDNYA